MTETASSVSNPKELDPVCANCNHKWSAHAVNDPEPKCSLRQVSETQTKWCGCGGFQMGCADCGHREDQHSDTGCRNVDRNYYGCSCRGYWDYD